MTFILMKMTRKEKTDEVLSQLRFEVLVPSDKLSRVQKAAEDSAAFVCYLLQVLQAEVHLQVLRFSMKSVAFTL